MTAASSLEDWIEANGGTSTHFGKTHYVAEIVGDHDKYNLDREFLSYKTDSSYSGKTGTKAVAAEDIEEGGVYEIRFDSWGNKKQRLVKVVEKVVTDDGVELTTKKLAGEDEAIEAAQSMAE